MIIYFEVQNVSLNVFKHMCLTNITMHTINSKIKSKLLKHMGI